MKFKNDSKHIVDLLFVLALFLVFAFFSLMLVIVGANVYRKTVDNSNINFSTQTAFSYIAEKIRQQDEITANDADSVISVEPFGEGDALVLKSTQKAEGAQQSVVYKTYIYLYQDSLRELFIKEGSQIGPEAGKEIFPLTAFTVEQVTGTLYRFHLQNGTETDITFQIGTFTGAQ